MSKHLDIYQKKLLDLLKTEEGSTGNLTLLEIGEQIGIDYAQGVINKLKQLENKGYIRKDEKGIYKILKDPVEDVVYFPLIGFAHCGNLIKTSLDEISIQDKIPFSTKSLPLNSKEELNRFFFTKAKGNSMEPIIHDGDLVLVKQQKEITTSDKVLLVHNGNPKIKYLKEKNGQYVLFSLNKDIDDFELSSSDEVEIIGVVKLIITNS